MNTPANASPAPAAAKWLRFSNLKLEATVFMLIALTFAAVLGQEAITGRELDLSKRAPQFYAYTYGDYQEGGKSEIRFDKAEPLKWSCALRPGTPFAYCGYGLFLDVTNTGTGVNFSEFQTVRAAAELPGHRRHAAHRAPDLRPAGTRPRRQANRHPSAGCPVPRQAGHQ